MNKACSFGSFTSLHMKQAYSGGRILVQLLHVLLFIFSTINFFLFAFHSSQDQMNIYISPIFQLRSSSVLAHILATFLVATLRHTYLSYTRTLSRNTTKLHRSVFYPSQHIATEMAPKRTHSATISDPNDMKVVSNDSSRQRRASSQVPKVKLPRKTSVTHSTSMAAKATIIDRERAAEAASAEQPMEPPRRFTRQNSTVIGDTFEGENRKVVPKGQVIGQIPKPADVPEETQAEALKTSTKLPLIEEGQLDDLDLVSPRGTFHGRDEDASVRQAPGGIDTPEFIAHDAKVQIEKSTVTASRKQACRSTTGGRVLRSESKGFASSHDYEAVLGESDSRNTSSDEESSDPDVQPNVWTAEISAEHDMAVLKGLVQRLNHATAVLDNPNKVIAELEHRVKSLNRELAKIRTGKELHEKARRIIKRMRKAHDSHTKTLRDGYESQIRDLKRDYDHSEKESGMNEDELLLARVRIEELNKQLKRYKSRCEEQADQIKFYEQAKSLPMANDAPSLGQDTTQAAESMGEPAGKSSGSNSAPPVVESSNALVTTRKRKSSDGSSGLAGVLDDDDSFGLYDDPPPIKKAKISEDTKAHGKTLDRSTENLGQGGKTTRVACEETDVSNEVGSTAD
ncbi:hypothetical protein EJ05DRAFT_246164 [Pseudovirgaria hyperparasitica]|uniref:Uncharacterized protein n=1 Tax=Pseudovirgaria hyperparasitica TaxID=470096 RepID=A0A6A6WFH8_9PEZI|nr:uncharacterized protein EJ05DRAFT_246164 [Pseudovirgaria hyperparasitica]KAF2760919.1 hypothetical protein EJ05DRAFT_246164 [Pseudovirgaria hyperparasitica]